MWGKRRKELAISLSKKPTSYIVLSPQQNLDSNHYLIWLLGIMLHFFGFSSFFFMKYVRYTQNTTVSVSNWGAGNFGHPCDSFSFDGLKKSHVALKKVNNIRLYAAFSLHRTPLYTPHHPALSSIKQWLYYFFWTFWFSPSLFFDKICQKGWKICYS